MKRLHWEAPNGNTFTFDIDGYDPAATVTPKSIRDSLPRDYKRLETAK